MSAAISTHDASAPLSRRQRLLARIAEVLACPQCRVPLEADAARTNPNRKCPQCGRVAEFRGEQFIFPGTVQHAVSADWLNRLKEAAKRRLGRCYPLAIQILSPVCVPDLAGNFLKSFATERELVADLGAGTTHHHEQAISVDGCSYPSVHVVADLERLPFQTGTLDGVISIAVLEHVPAPEVHVREMRRVLRPGGRVACFVPFIQGYHASPHDYQRLTSSGMRQLFREFEVLELRVGAGPTSALLWVLQEWLALTLSLGSARLYRLLMPLTWILSPLKYLDLVLARHPAAGVIASGFYIEARKRARTDE